MKLLKIVCRTLLAHPFTATDGLATLRGAKAVALPARARMTEVFILQIYPLLFLLSKSHDDMACGKKCTRPGSWVTSDLGGGPNTDPGSRRAGSGGPHLE